ncbi:MAG TPA: DPP IV N-terminal domain-containing protein [Polyangiaceae bacterium]
MRAWLRLPVVLALAACAPPAPLAPVASTPPRPPDGDQPLHPSPYDARADAAPDTELLRALARTRNFHLGSPAQAALTPDARSVLFLRSAASDPRQSLFEMDVATGSVRELVSPAALLSGPETLSPEERVRRERMRVRATGLTSLELSTDGKRAMVTLSGRVFLVDRATGQPRELATGEGAAIDPHLSPDGARVAYVRDDDLFVVPAAGGREVRLTRGGTERLTHGLAEFVAEEELDRHRGFWWSPDGARLLYEEADTSKVDVLTIADAAHPEQPAQRIAYPRPGRANADVRFGLVASSGGATTWVQWDRARFPYVAQASWPRGGPPVLYVLDRLQRTGQLLAVEPGSGKTTLLVEERDEAWLDVDPSVPRWLADGKGFVWSSERSGEWQLELRDATGKLVRELLPKGSGYVELSDVDEKKRTAVVVASADPTAAAPWLVSLDAAAPPRRLGAEAGVASAVFGESHDAYVAAEATLAAMPRAVVRSVDGAGGREIPSVAESPSAMPGVELAEVGPDRVRVAVVRPRGFRPDHRYAVIDAAYGGPHVVVVTQSALGFLRAQWMADATGAIVVAIDARGTPRRGREWERALDRKLGSVPLEGHVAALRELGARYHEMDLSRVGVYGWSFGGYFAALAVLARPDVYRVGVAGAPPADWRDYDTAYTERYLGLPEDSAAAYDAASLLTYAARPAAPDAARPLLVVHGTADDNVWFLNGIKLADALERGHRPFEFVPLAGTSHMLLDPTLSEDVWLRAAEVLRAGLREPSSPQ